MIEILLEVCLTYTNEVTGELVTSRHVTATDNLHRTYRIHMYGCELWYLNCNYVTDFKVEWRKIKRRIWRLSYRVHNVIVHNLSYDIDLLLT